MAERIEKFKIFHPSTCCIVGPTSSGKTSFIINLLNNKDDIFDRKINKVIWCYKSYQSKYDEIKSDNIIFHEGICDLREIQKDGTNAILVLDDVMSDLNKTVADIFTVYSHHLNTTVFFLAQNLFPRNRFMRDVTLNTQYLILFAQRRDLSQLTVLARQTFPGLSKDFLKVYNEMVSKKYGYCVLDMHPSNLQRILLRTNIFPEEHEIVYLPNDF